MAKTYSEKLKDPKWQRKRLEIMERDTFQCQICWNKEETLTVHHKSYIKGRDPWDYDDEYLITLCEDCHQSVHYWEKNIKNNPNNSDYWLYGFNVTDWRMFHKRIEMIHQKEGGNAIKSIIQLLTAYTIELKEL